MKFLVDGKEVESYDLTNLDLLNHYYGETDAERKQELIDIIVARFNRHLCPQFAGETMDDVAATFIKNYVENLSSNTKDAVKHMTDKETTNEFAQHKIFMFFLEFIARLAIMYKEREFGRGNGWACMTADKIMHAMQP
jgi:hypothetical protein